MNSVIIDSLITKSYKTVSQYISTKLITQNLIQDKFVVLIDEKSAFIGLLTLSDLVNNPRNIAIDCLTKKPELQINVSFSEVLSLMKETHCIALPVFNERDFVGAITFDGIINYFTHYKNELEEKIFTLSDEIISLKQAIENGNQYYCNDEKTDEEKKYIAFKLNHEIKAPINTIIGRTSMLLNDSTLNKQSEDIKVIQKSALFLNKLVDNILSFSKIKSGKSIIEESEFSINELTTDIFDMMACFLSGKDIKLVKKIDKTIDFNLIGDQIKLKQIIINLLSNAIKYTPRGQIELLIKEIERTYSTIKIKFVIIDTGIGIPKDKIHKLFDDFYRIQNSITNQSNGYGLGLAISQNLVNLLGGTIKVDSTEGKGSEFYFELLFKYSDKSNKIHTQFSSIKKLKFLIADDDETNRILLKKFFVRMGHQTEEVNDGRCLVEKLKTENYDFILLDIMMPFLDGYQAAKIIRKEMQINTPIIGLSASALEHIKENCTLFGMNGCLSKPINFDDLHKLINKINDREKPGAVDNLDTPFLSAL